MADNTSSQTYQVRESTALVVVKIVILQLCIGVLALIVHAILLSSTTTTVNLTVTLTALAISDAILQSADAGLVILSCFSG